MENWTIVMKDGKDFRMKTIQQGTVTINIYRPILTEEERKKREEQIINVISRIFRDIHKRDPELYMRLTSSEDE